MRKRMRRGKACLRMFKGRSPRKTPELDRIAANFKKAALHISASAENMVAGLRHVAQMMGSIKFDPPKPPPKDGEVYTIPAGRLFVVDPTFGDILVGDTRPFTIQPKTNKHELQTASLH